MELTNGEKTSDLRECQAQVLVWNQILSYINSMSLKCAVELGIPDVIHNHGRPMTLPDLVSALGIPQARAGFLHRLMRMLSHSGFFALQTEQPCVNRDKGEEKPEGYVLTPPSQLLLKGDRSSKSMHPLVAFVVHPILIQPFNGLSKWFHSDSSGTPFEMQHGRAFWEYIARDPDFNLLTNEGMASDSSVVVSEIMDKCRRSFEQSTSVVDVGGGTGLLARKIADTFPHLEVTVLDLPHVWILHDWNDEEGVKILKRCKNAVTSNGKDGGKVIVIDVVLDDQEDEACSEMGLLFDMMMMATLTGRERCKKEWAKLFLDAGFRKYGITPLVGPRCLIEVQLPLPLVLEETRMQQWRGLSAGAFSLFERTI
ncbi:hypothetical protein CRG98_022957 [Punica granatum]|uniref:Trans-resveratrol di-O-methyltransferase-like n=1 Tax=Punica granatum TaxID=22663 RepID=A0A2I0JK31_PUNGR|nr:hypothetical protein CRG98_022957 [Punica granatum]